MSTIVRSTEPTGLSAIVQFCRAADLLSFRAAAEQLGLSPAAVSRSIARLEARLGVRLFVRNTRRINLTDEGRLYHAQCRQALAQIEEAERALTGRQSAPRGLLRISVPTTYGHYRVLPLLADFHARCPEVQVEVQISNRNIDFVDDGYDLCIRLASSPDGPQDSRLVARKLEDAEVAVYAAPDYLRRRGTPQRLEDLAAHSCIQFIRPSTGRPMPWLFREPGDAGAPGAGRDLELSFDGAVRIGEDVLGCLNAARAGLGLCQMYRFIAADAVARGELVEVLPENAGRTRAFHLLFPHNRHLSPRVRAFVDFLVERLRASQDTRLQPMA